MQNNTVPPVPLHSDIHGSSRFWDWKRIVIVWLYYFPQPAFLLLTSHSLTLEADNKRLNQPKTKCLFSKPNRHQIMSALILLDLHCIHHKFTVLCHLYQTEKLLDEKYILDWPKLVRSSRVPLYLGTQLHRSFHYISHSPLNLIITASVPEPSLGLCMATVLSWIELVSGPIVNALLSHSPLQSYLHTESNYYCGRVSVCTAQSMSVCLMCVWSCDLCINHAIYRSIWGFVYVPVW